MDLFRKLGKLFLSGGVDEEEFVALFSGIHHASPPDSEEVFLWKDSEQWWKIISQSVK